MRRFFQNTFRGLRYFWYFYSSWEILVSLSKITAELKYLQETERFLVTRIKDQGAATAALRRSLKFVNSLFVCLFLFSFIVYSTVGKTICEWTGRGRAVGQKQQHWPKGYADLNRAESPPPPGGLGTRSLLASPLIKTATTTFALGHFLGHTAVVTANAR